MLVTNTQVLSMSKLAPLLIALTSVSFAADTPKKPNVIFLFADDQRADTIGALGNPHIKNAEPRSAR